MAITTIHSIKCTMQYSLDYIMNPDKTDEKMLVSGYGCEPEFAANEFEQTRDEAKREGVNLGYHIIQSFAPDEIDKPENAHEIGRKLADELFNGKYEYVIATHVDKGHVHNHIIFNSVDTVEHEHYKSTPRSYYKMREVSDKLCAENGLSVIDNPKKSFAKKNQKSNQLNKKKNNPEIPLSFSEKLKKEIDICINNSNSFEEFIDKMKDRGYTTDPSRKALSFKDNESKVHRKVDTLRGKYTEAEIRKRVIEPKVKQHVSSHDDKHIQSSENQEIKRAFTPEQLEFFAQRKESFKELKNIVNVINFIEDNKINSYDEADKLVLEQLKNAISTSRSIQGQLVVLEDKIERLDEIYITCREYVEIKQNYDRASNKGKQELKSSIDIITNKLRQLKVEKIPNPQVLSSEIKELKNEKQRLNLLFNNAKKSVEKVSLFRKDIENSLQNKPSKNREKELQFIM